MNSQELVSASNGAQVNQSEQSVDASRPEDSLSNSPPLDRRQPAQRLSPFWRDRLVEACMVFAMAGYYVVGNNHLGASKIFHINPLLSLPFLLAFAILSWYRLAFAVALVPMAVPYYYLEKPIYSHYEF